MRLTRDRVPVILHDASLERATGQGGRVSELTYDQLSRRPLGGTQEIVPRMDQVLQLVAGRVPVMVEIKSMHVAPGRISGLVADLLDDYAGPVCVASFNPRVLGWFRRHRPELPRVMTAGSLRGVPMPSLLRRRLSRLKDLALLQPAAVSYELEGLPSPVTDRWRDNGGALVAWTVQDDEELTRASSLADNVIFEHVRP